MKNILIIDDEGLIRYSIASLFHDPATTVFSVEQGAAGMQAILDHPIDLCFLDIHLPDANGLDLMKTMRDISPRTRIIIMTGSEITGTMLKSIQEHAHCLMSKPFDLEQVGAAAHRLMTVKNRTEHDDEPHGINEESTICWITCEQRKHPRRQPQTGSTASFKTIAAQGSQGALAADVLDISESGICIRTDAELKPGEIVKMNGSSPGRDGIVRWCVPADSVRSFRAGIQFVAAASLLYLQADESGRPSNIAPAGH
ncbi:MAG: response regulator [Nitrospiraceae bacterium]|nr:response regulator [Nitrospiraceae bacterium]